MKTEKIWLTNGNYIQATNKKTFQTRPELFKGWREADESELAAKGITLEKPKPKPKTEVIKQVENYRKKVDKAMGGDNISTEQKLTELTDADTKEETESKAKKK